MQCKKWEMNLVKKTKFVNLVEHKKKIDSEKIGNTTNVPQMDIIWTNRHVRKFHMLLRNPMKDEMIEVVHLLYHSLRDVHSSKNSIN